MCCFFRCCCRCGSGSGSGQIPQIPTMPIPTPITNVAARFTTLVSSEVSSGSIIPLSNTAFNNAEAYVINNSGAVTLVGPGLYLVNYSVNATNNSETDLLATVNVTVNGAGEASASASSFIPAGEVENLSGSTLVNVPQGTSSTVALTLTSPEALSVVANMVVTKLS